MAFISGMSNLLGSARQGIIIQMNNYGIISLLANC
jgi:hypothetical protein